MALTELRQSIVERRNFLAPSLKLDDQKFEFIFVLDQSGSMEGDPILLARRALTLFLRSLPTTCIFNVISFGSSFNKLFSKSVPYTQDNLNAATHHAANLMASLGGTALAPPMRDIYDSAQTPGFLTQIFVLTDGDNDEGTPAITNVIRANKTFARIFSLGIGSRVSISLINGMADEGGGVAEFVQSSEKIETKILDQLKISLRPSLLRPVMVGN